jgi:hypothetical protein
VELPLDWLRDLHEPLLSSKPAINFIAPRFGLALEIFHYSPNIFIDLDWFIYILFLALPSALYVLFGWETSFNLSPHVCRSSGIHCFIFTSGRLPFPRFVSVMPLSMGGMVLRYWLSRLLAFLCLLTCAFALGFRLQKLLMFPLKHCIVLSSTTDSGLVLRYSPCDHLWPCHEFGEVPRHPSALFSPRLALTCSCNYSGISGFVLRFLFVRA